ncbi:MAG TPA: serine kinase [Burkholderiaceae bacterium]|nr:serine kinase [Burkholderiaceae bacterium]
MEIDWKLLGAVRERQKTAAQERAARDREAAERSRREADEAAAAWQAQLAAKQCLWQQARDAGRLDVTALRQAQAWSRALDGRIADAARAAQEAWGRHEAHLATLDESRRRLRAAAAELEKARQMQQRSRAQRLRRAELRQDEVAEESSAQRWLLQRRA